MGAGRKVSTQKYLQHISTLGAQRHTARHCSSAPAAFQTFAVPFRPGAAPACLLRGSGRNSEEVPVYSVGGGNAYPSLRTCLLFPSWVTV